MDAGRIITGGGGVGGDGGNDGGIGLLSIRRKLMQSPDPGKGFERGRK
jgi:hypothetical protein